ncbi:MAG: aspartate kinase [Thermoanaerobaculia bacterium]|nr:aspartate kinase [Thermoanaerobaculia bacterium]
MIVLKFGGTSVGSPESLRKAVEIVESVSDRSPIVVVSALSGVTNRLVDAVEAAADGDLEKARKAAADIRKRHEEIAWELVIQKSDFLESFTSQLERHVEEITTILEGAGLLHEVTLRARDKIVAIGEKLSSVLFAYTMMTKKLNGVAVDSENVIVTNEEFGNADPLMPETRKAAREHLVPEVERGHIPVIGGYVGRSKGGATTTLGRGGSDYSAAIIGAAVDCEEIQIWTDVDGMMTTDPRVISEARVIDLISYDEAAELAYFGAKVLHPKTIAPAVENEIPIRVKNTHNPSGEGTLITRTGKGTGAEPRAVVMKRGITVIDVTSPDMLGVSGMLARIFDVFGRHGVSVDVVSTSEVSVSATFDRPEMIDALAGDLERFGDVTAHRDQVLIGVVGRELLSHPRSGWRVFEALTDVPITLVSLASAGVNMCIVVSEEDADRALRQIHSSIFEGSNE